MARLTADLVLGLTDKGPKQLVARPPLDVRDLDTRRRRTLAGSSPLAGIIVPQDDIPDRPDEPEAA